MKAIYVEDIIYDFLSSQKKDYGSFNNVVKAILRKLAKLQEESEEMRDTLDNDKSYIKEVLLESVRHPQNISSYSGGVNNKTLNVSGPPIPQKVPEKSGFARDLQLVFNAMEGDSVKPSDFLKVQNEIEEKKLLPPPPPPKGLQKPESDES